MSKVHDALYQEIWDELNEDEHEVSLDAIDAIFVERVLIDLATAKEDACKAARRSVDRERTKFHGAQLAFPVMADPNEYLVTAKSARVQKAKALDPDFLAALALSDENLSTQFSANQARHALYRKLAPYLHRGLTYNLAVSAYWNDHPSQQAAD